jgi:hypothetical protein
VHGGRERQERIVANSGAGLPAAAGNRSGCARRFKSSSLAGQPVLVLSRRAIDHVGLGAMLAGWRHVTGGQRTKGMVTGVQLLVGLSWGLPGQIGWDQ